jgi:hypothetical protein
VLLLLVLVRGELRVIHAAVSHGLAGVGSGSNRTEGDE